MTEINKKECLFVCDDIQLTNNDVRRIVNKLHYSNIIISNKTVKDHLLNKLPFCNTYMLSDTSQFKELLGYYSTNDSCTFHLFSYSLLEYDPSYLLKCNELKENCVFYDHNEVVALFFSNKTDYLTFLNSYKDNRFSISESLVHFKYNKVTEHHPFYSIYHINKLLRALNKTTGNFEELGKEDCISLYNILKNNAFSPSNFTDMLFNEVFEHIERNIYISDNLEDDLAFADTLARDFKNLVVTLLNERDIANKIYRIIISTHNQLAPVIVKTPYIFNASSIFIKVNTSETYFRETKKSSTKSIYELLGLLATSIYDNLEDILNGYFELDYRGMDIMYPENRYKNVLKDIFELKGYDFKLARLLGIYATLKEYDDIILKSEEKKKALNCIIKKIILQF